MEEIYKNLSLEDLPGEIWKDVKGYEDSYQVSNMGRVKSKARNILNSIYVYNHIKEKILRQYMKNTGYLAVSFSKKSQIKQLTVHELVGKTFIENPANKPQINHIDCNKLNNNVGNLEWNSAYENVRHSIVNGLENHQGEHNNNSKLSDIEVLEIKKNILDNLDIKDIAIKYNVTKGCIRDIKLRDTWKHILLD